MYISVDDLDFLIELENELGDSEGWSERVGKLWSLNEKLLAQREQTNAKVRQTVAERRKDNPNYARKKA